MVPADLSEWGWYEEADCLGLDCDSTPQTRCLVFVAMITSLSTICVMTALLLVNSAYAQGELGDMPMPPPRTKATPEQRAAGKAKRRAEGHAAAMASPVGEMGPEPRSQAAMPPRQTDKAESRGVTKSATGRATQSDDMPRAEKPTPKN